MTVEDGEGSTLSSEAPEKRPMSPLLPLRGYYFFTYAALGGLFPFLPLLLSSRGLVPSEIAWIMVMIPATNLAVPPIWGAAADALRARLRLLQLA